METNAERRRKKLETFCRERGLKVVAEVSGLNWQYIDQAIKKTLLPAKKDGTRGYRKMSDEAFEKIEDAFKLGRGWFDEMLIQAPSTTATPPSASPTLADTLTQLGQVIAASDKLTRAQIKPILDQLLEHPEQAAELGHRLEATLELTPLQTPPVGGIAGEVLAAKPITRTQDFAKKTVKNS